MKPKDVGHIPRPDLVKDVEKLLSIALAGREPPREDPYAETKTAYIEDLLKYCSRLIDKIEAGGIDSVDQETQLTTIGGMLDDLEQIAEGDARIRVRGVKGVILRLHQRNSPQEIVHTLREAQTIMKNWLRFPAALLR